MLRHESAAVAVEPEDPLFILYTSGTTGLPKGAILTHRSELARTQVMPFDLHLEPGNNNLCWPPLYHMGGTEPALHALLTGGRVIVIDGFDPERIASAIETEPLPWVSIMPGTLSAMIGVLERRNSRPRGVKTCGVMADLSPPHEVERLAELLDADFCNCFGSTETGTPPLSGRVLPRGKASDLGKGPSLLTELKLVDVDGDEVPDGEVGELAMRGPTVFGGYWQNEAATMADFRGGWFHMGDLLRRRPDGLYDFVDRAKYMIKSGGENIYPAEIERVLLAHPSIADAVVVRRKDDRWGEVPVALVVTNDPALDPADIAAHCQNGLASYKRPERHPHCRGFSDRQIDHRKSAAQGSRGLGAEQHAARWRLRLAARNMTKSSSNTRRSSSFVYIPRAMAAASPFFSNLLFPSSRPIVYNYWAIAGRSYDPPALAPRRARFHPHAVRHLRKGAACVSRGGNNQDRAGWHRRDHPNASRHRLLGRRHGRAQGAAASESCWLADGHD